MAILTEYGINTGTESTSVIRKNSMACVAFPTCPLALAEAQRYLPSLIDKIELLLGKHSLGRRRDHYPDDRLSQWLRTFLCGGDRFCRNRLWQIQYASRRR
jgi:hypothetical protein